MKSSQFLFTIAVSFILSSVGMAAENIESDFDSLGGNAVLLEKAKALNPEMETSVVQSREVNRRNRFELAPEFSGSFGGDTYVKTQGLGISAYYHITPRWSVGVKYKTAYNKLTAEGEAMAEKAYQDYIKNPKSPEANMADLNYPLSETMAVVNWYPIYGKINLLDAKVVQFDTYLLAGSGQVQLKSGSTNSVIAGVGIGFWLTPKISTRFEMLYQSYTARYYSGDKKLDLAVAGAQMGWLL